MALVFEVLNRVNVAPDIAKIQATQRAYLEDYLKDQEDLNSIDLFTRNFPKEKNAGTLLNPIFSWHPGFNNEDSVPPSGKYLEIKQRFKEAAIRYGKDWMNHNSWFNQEEFDFKIFEALREFDHWDIETNSPIDVVGTSQPFLNGIELPVPDVTNLTILAQFYLMKAVEKKNSLEALQDVRHLATLLLSTENLSLEMTGLRLLDYERVAHNYYIQNNILKEEEWKPLSASILLQATRAWPATAGFLNLVTPDATFNKVFKEHLPVGLCAALNTAAPHNLLLKSMLYSRIWPEVNLKDEYARQDELISLARSQCGLKYLSRLMASGSSYHHLPAPFLFKILPISRRTYGMKLATVGFTGFETYSDPLNRQRDPSSE